MQRTPFSLLFRTSVCLFVFLSVSVRLFRVFLSNKNLFGRSNEVLRMHQSTKTFYWMDTCTPSHTHAHTHTHSHTHTCTQTFEGRIKKTKIMFFKVAKKRRVRYALHGR
jgi:hypothetical protein